MCKQKNLTNYTKTKNKTKSQKERAQTQKQIKQNKDLFFILQVVQHIKKKSSKLLFLEILILVIVVIIPIPDNVMLICNNIIFVFTNQHNCHLIVQNYFQDTTTEN